MKFQRNLESLRKIIPPGIKIMQVLKADAYGHGIGVCSKYSEKYIDYFAVATLQEALVIRANNCVKPILLFGRLEEIEVETAVINDITISLFSMEYANMIHNKLIKLRMKLNYHLKLDTGMNRLGFKVRDDNFDKVLREISGLFFMANLTQTGIFTHLSRSDEVELKGNAFTKKQMDLFRDFCSLLLDSEIDIGIRHLLSSGGFLNHPEGFLDMIRVGMLPLGQTTYKAEMNKLELESILKWFAKVIDIQWLKKDESISYGGIYTATKDEKIAVIAIGYSDGFFRGLSNNGLVLINGFRAPIIGKICMDFTFVDVTNVPIARVGDTAVILGTDGEYSISVNDLSEKVPFGSNGGITSSIASRVPRIYNIDNRRFFAEIKIIEHDLDFKEN